MASDNDGVLNNFGKNSTNCNNNESNESTANSTENENLSGTSGDKTSRTIGIDVLPVEHQRREENPFSFKHFLNRETTSVPIVSSNSNTISNNATASTATHHNVTVFASSIGLSNNQSVNGSNNNSNPLADDFGLSSSYRSSASNAVPADLIISSSPSSVAPVSSTFSIASMSSQQTSTGARPKVHTMSTTTSISSLAGETSKMKRSPRFPSFDSQASLVEYAGCNSGGPCNRSCDHRCSEGGGLMADRNTTDSMSNFFPDNDDDRQYVHRSFSNYDIELAPRTSYNCGGSTSPRRRPSPTGIGPTLNSDDLHSEVPYSSRRRKQINLQSLNNPQTMPGSVPVGNDGGLGVGVGVGQRPASEFSAVLPDFVQDHLVMEQWYSDMNINSPPNSRMSPVDFVEDLPSMTNPTEKCQTLPDFLSDGPIIHSSSGRLADVASGLPDLDSPEENSPSTQLARLRLENDRLRRELDESRLALAEQTRRAGELERRLEQVRSNETSFSVNLAQSLEQVGENLDRSNKRAAAAQSQVTKLKQQVKQLTAEADALRRENESLREEGAVGGDRMTRRPLRTQQLSRDLMRAASNAESNLRQLLTGVENLRLMAATIENMDCNAIDSNNQSNPIINEEFLSDCDADYDDFTGPAL